MPGAGCRGPGAGTTTGIDDEVVVVPGTRPPTPGTLEFQLIAGGPPFLSNRCQPRKRAAATKTRSIIIGAGDQDVSKSLSGLRTWTTTVSESE